MGYNFSPDYQITYLLAQVFLMLRPLLATCGGNGPSTLNPGITPWMPPSFHLAVPNVATSPLVCMHSCILMFSLFLSISVCICTCTCQDGSIFYTNILQVFHLDRSLLVRLWWCLQCCCGYFFFFRVVINLFPRRNLVSFDLFLHFPFLLIVSAAPNLLQKTASSSSLCSSLG